MADRWPTDIPGARGEPPGSPLFFFALAGYRTRAVERGFRIVAAARHSYNFREGQVPSLENGPGRAAMNVSISRPPVSDLVFHLYSRPLHPEFFDILAVRRVQRDGYDLTVRITRTGHVMSWENRVAHLTEVTGAADQDLPTHRRLLGHKLRGEQNARIACTGGVRYQTSYQVEVLPADIYAHVHEEILADGRKRGLLHNFRPHHRLALAPLGFVAVEARTDCLLLSSFHTFPDEYTVVKTQSLIERANASPS